MESRSLNIIAACTTRSWQNLQSIAYIQMKGIAPYKYKTNVVLVDLDDTVWHAGDIYHGSSKWFASCLGYIGPQSVFRTESELIQLYAHHQKHIVLQLTMPNLPQIVNDLKVQGVSVIALTARGPMVQKSTDIVLDRLKLEFDDVIMCDGKNKGDCVLDWMVRMNLALHETNIITAIDDDIRSLKHIAIAFPHIRELCHVVPDRRISDQTNA